MRRTRIVHIMALLPLLLSLTGCKKTQDQRPAAPVAVRVTRPIRTDLALRLPYLATVHATTEVKLIAQIQGTIAALPRNEGDRVRKGEVLLRLHAPELESTVQRLRAERDYWCSKSKADERLFADGAVPEDQMEAGKRACINAEAAYEEGSARLRKAVEHASLTGTVLRRYVESGQHVMPGQPLLLLGDDEAELRVDVVEEDLRRGIRIGMPVFIHVDENERVPGTVREVAARSNMPSRTFTVKISLDEKSNLLQRNGASLPVDFVIASASQVLALPVSAIADRREQPHIYLVRDDHAHRQPVELGVQDGNLLEVRFPWNGSDVVAVSNLHDLEDSALVIPVDVGEVQR